MKTSHLFSLDKLFPYARKGAYFVDREGALYSTIHPTAVSTGQPVKLSGTFSPSYGKCFKLKTTNFYGPPLVLSTNALGNALKSSPEFNEFSKKNTFSATVSRSFIETVSSAPLMKPAATIPAPEGRFIVGSVKGNSYSFSQEPKVHFTRVSARTEAERLAKLNPGKSFVVANIEASVEAAGVVWK